MNRLATPGWVAGVLVLSLGCGRWGVWGLAAEPAGSPQQTSWSPKLYGFCIETHDVRKRTLPEQAALLRELGFDGAGYPLWLDDSLEKNLKILDDAGLSLYLAHTRVSVRPGTSAYDPRILEAMHKLKGRPTTISVLLQGLPPGDPQGEPQALRALRELGDAARRNGLRVSIYHHTGDWTQSLLDAIKVARKLNHPAVGVNFNLCHWLMVDGDKDYRPVLRANADILFAVTLNGAQRGAKTWTNGLIQPLDRGDFDNRELLATLRQIGYRGPVGLMCYGILGDAREHLQRSMQVWKSWQR